MKSILIASTNPEEIRALQAAIGEEYRVSVIRSPQNLDDQLKQCGLVLLDRSFMEHYGEELANDILQKACPPVLMLTPPSEIRSAVEAMSLGACNYIVKAGDYHEVLNALIGQSLKRFSEREEMKRTIIALRARVNELEQRLAAVGEEDVEPRRAETQEDILDQIVFIFKRGEITLPSHPKISIKFKELVNQGSNLQQIANLLRKDVACSSKLMSVSNSAYYRGLTENKTLEQAIGRLGLTTARRYVEAISNRALYICKNKQFLEFVNKLWEHSLSCAYATQIVSETLRLELPDDAFTLGLMHDIGKLLLFQAVGELQLRGKLGKNVDTAELFNTVDTHHGKFGAALLKKWKFSAGYVQVAAYHDSLEQADPISKELLVVHFANLLVKSMGYTLKDEEEIDLEETESARLLKLDLTSINEIKEQVQKAVEELKGHFA